MIFGTPFMVVTFGFRLLLEYNIRRFGVLWFL